MTDSPRHKRFAAIIGAIPVLIILLASGAFVVNGSLTAWVNGPSFKEMIDRETSKGLKLQGNFSSLQRVGLLGVSSDSFSGTDGYKTIVDLQGKDITGTFNPLGVILRRWELDSIHIKSGTVMLQKTHPDPNAPKTAPPPPWWALFWPYRIHLADVKVDEANVLWKLHEKESGIYDTFVEITPNGRDFEYDAQGGELRTPVTPTLQVRHAHLLIRKPRVYCSDFVLADNTEHPDRNLRVTGEAGLQDDHSIQLKIDLAKMNVARWLPEKLRSHVEGLASGHFDYNSTDTGLETGHGDGTISISDGMLRKLAPVHQYVTVTGSPDPGEMALKTCKARIHWEGNAITAQDIEAECEGVFRLTGTLNVARDQTLSGELELGLTDSYLHWLPSAQTAIFTREEGPYHFTTIRFSGTLQKPEQDLSPRLAHEVAKSPLVAIKLFFNQAGAWFNLD